MDVVDHLRHQSIFRWRAILTFVVCVLIFALLLGRLTYLQLQSHAHFEALSENNRVRIQASAPPRGLIYDRFGKVLAENRPSFRLEIVPEQTDDVQNTIESLTEFFTFSDAELARFRRAMRREGRFNSIPLKFNLAADSVAQFAVQKHRFPGVDIVGHLSRYYPQQALAAHALGYVGRIDTKEQARLDQNPEDKANYSASTHIGKLGIEAAYEHLLHGQVGYRTVESNAEGRAIRVLESTPPMPGKDIYLTIDHEMQTVAEQALQGEAGVVLVQAVDTGELLTFASLPAYNLQPFVHGISFADYAELRDDIDIPLFNRATLGQYPPGSVLKPFIGLGALETELPFADEEYLCRGVYQLDNDRTNHRYRDWKKFGHGMVDLQSSIVESCDVYFYELARQLGIDSIHNILTAFGFGQATGVDIAGEKAGLVPNRAWKRRTFNEPWYNGETLISGIGQGFMLTTPLQIVNATAAIATQGKRYQPRLLHAVYDPMEDKLQTEAVQPLAQVPVKDNENWATVQAAMLDVVVGEKGTARGINNKNYLIAGKTGTAQVKSIAQDEEYDAEAIDKKLRDHALFSGYAPADAPEIAVFVLVENGGSGGGVAAPIAKQVMDVYFNKRDQYRANEY